ncbi:(2Fe-2S)-binding protein [Dongia sedimenti]|uniref:(2Fe-2S)-binding protein n=1 Tax=Dongia sedimenti TaxID=3064282 RepID=A0ABU0YV69_9PROT|nr:(2Fe-2S)-binding protein [Rhodospirillaceae bacterium R-7]
MGRGQFRRVAERERRRIAFLLDGVETEALEGDTVLIAILTTRAHLRMAEFTEAPRAGFCLMGACQDCWVASADGRSLRACTTYVAEGMAIVTRR